MWDGCEVVEELLRAFVTGQLSVAVRPVVPDDMISGVLGVSLRFPQEWIDRTVRKMFPHE